MLRRYWKEITKKEGYTKDVDQEEKRKILLKYFNYYTFLNESEAIDFFQFMEVVPRPATQKVVLELAAHNLQFKYNVKVEWCDFTIKITPKPQTKVFSFNQQEGWHEGYDPFIDENECYGDTLEEAMASLTVSKTSHLWPIQKPIKMGLITESCGYGKTYWVEHSMVDEINHIADCWNDLRDFTHYEKKDVLFITTRRSILDQQLKYGEVVSAVEEDFSNSSLSWMEERPNKVRIITTSKLGSLYKEGKIEKMFPIVVVDELHSLFLDTMFAEESYHCIECLKHFWYETIKVGLTATPQMLFNYIDIGQDLFYVLDEVPLVPKYGCEDTVYLRTYIENAVKTVNPSPTEKVLVYCSSAKKAISMAEKREDGAYLISKYSKYTEAVERQQDLYNYIVENNKLPDDINILFMTSAYREGVEIKDDNITTIIIEASDDITISQFVGRVRGNIQSLKIVIHDQQLKKWMDNTIEYGKLLKGTYEDWVLRYGRQVVLAEKNENITLLVQKSNGKYKLNEYFEPITRYLIDCYQQADNERLNNRLVSIGDRPMKTTLDYLNSFLGEYSKGTIRKSSIDIERANWLAADEYLNRRLYKADKDELCEKINWIDTDNSRLVKWTKVKQELLKRGYKIEDKVSGSKRFTIISH